MVDPAASVTTVSVQALAQVDRLERTVEDLLALSRDLPAPADPVWLVAGRRELRGPLPRPLGTRGRSPGASRPADALPPAAFPEAALRQVLDVLRRQRARARQRHGHGRARSGGTGCLGVVDDEGLLPDGDPEAMFRRRSRPPAAPGSAWRWPVRWPRPRAPRLLAARSEDGTRFTLADGRVGAAPGRASAPRPDLCLASWA